MTNELIKHYSRLINESDYKRDEAFEDLKKMVRQHGIPAWCSAKTNLKYIMDCGCDEERSRAMKLYDKWLENDTKVTCYFDFLKNI